MKRGRERERERERHVLLAWIWLDVGFESTVRMCEIMYGWICLRCVGMSVETMVDIYEISVLMHAVRGIGT